MQESEEFAIDGDTEDYFDCTVSPETSAVFS